MIHYQLRCSAGHAFDGWFRDSAAFDSQADRGLVECPACGDTEIARGMMCPAVGRGRTAPQQVPVAAKPQPPSMSGMLPDQLRAGLQRMRAEVEKRCENVGDSFAEEARRIHNGQSPARGIYGDATPEQAERLADDGINVAQIPWLPRSDS